MFYTIVQLLRHDVFLTKKNWKTVSKVKCFSGDRETLVNHLMKLETKRWIIQENSFVDNVLGVNGVTFQLGLDRMVVRNGRPCNKRVKTQEYKFKILIVQV